MDEARRALTREKLRAHRERLRRQSLRPIQIWVPDVRTHAFAAEARRQCLLVNASDQEADDQAFVDAISICPDHGPEGSAARSGPSPEVAPTPPSLALP